jgi:nucleotide-binding universal stress UspA family protein
MKTILLAYDDTEPCAHHALERASALAKAFQAQLIVTSVTPVTLSIGRSHGLYDSVDSPQHHAEELAEARAYLEEQGVAAEYVPASGSPAETIVALAEQRGAELIIVGTHGPNLIERMLGQSVSQSVAHKSHTDVMIVH